MQQVLRMLETRDTVHVTELAETFAVSEVTIRSDLSSLARQGLVARVRGGVRALQRGHSELAFDLRLRIDAEQKRLKEGDLLLIASVGAGFTVGTVLMRWGLKKH